MVAKDIEGFSGGIGMRIVGAIYFVQPCYVRWREEGGVSYPCLLGRAW